jgi:pyruvate/2-oxoglutarate dehydrogenase complex dihydrolipoamide acyltransferase (E2) component
MAVAIKMPKMSDTMTEGVVRKWNFKVGDTIKSGDILAEVETDKATMDLENYEKGTILHFAVGEGDAAPVDGVIAIVGKAGEDFSALLNSGASAAPSAPVVETATKKTKTPKVESAPAPEPVVVVAPVETPSTDTETPLAEQSVEFLAKLQQLSIMISTLKSDYRALEKKWSREVKAAQKVSSKRKRKAGNRAPSGFVKPTKISDELASFLGKDKGSEMARTEVTRDINKYIRLHNLQDKENGRKIIPDIKLAALLKLNKTDELTYFNLQRYMSPHFAKATKEVAVVA